MKTIFVSLMLLFVLANETFAISTADNPANFEVEKKQQLRYLKLHNEYLKLKLKAKLLQKKVAHVAVRHSRQELNYTSDAAMMVVPAPESAGESFPVVAENIFASDIDANAITNKSGFGLIFIEERNGRFNATINYNGKFYVVVLGTILSDGSKVFDISKSQVILGKGSKYFRLTSSGMTAI